MGLAGGVIAGHASWRRHTNVRGFRLHSVHQGVGPDVVLLHGLSGSSRWWRFTVPALVKRYRVHVLDLIGFGSSRPAARQPDVAEMADVLAEWLDTLGIAGPHVVGHSMGGQVAVHMAAEAESAMRTLVLVCASGIPRVRALAEAARILGGALRPRSWGMPLFVPSIAADALRAGPRTLLQAGLHLLADDIRPLLPQVHCPTLIVWGALDPLLPVEDGQTLAAAIPGAQLTVIGDAAHNPMVDRAVEFNRVLLDFLDRH
jgi:pimeloyl-ACP methyl ester carboxylesterase